MSRQYLRTYSLEIVSAEGSSRTITGLKVTFEITKTVLSFPNLAKIIVHGYSDVTLALAKSTGTSISFHGGYGGNNQLLFQGNIINVFHSNFGTERTMTLFAGDGKRDWDNAIFNSTFSANVSVSTAIEEVLATFKDSVVGTLQGMPMATDKLRGQTLSGSSSDILDGFAEEYGFSWSIQNGEVDIVPDDQILQGTTAVVIKSETGMVGSPTITEIGADVVALLNPRLLPNVAFTIESSSNEIAIGNLFFRDIKKTIAAGTYKVQEVVFSGDTREGDWHSSVKGISI